MDEDQRVDLQLANEAAKRGVNRAAAASVEAIRDRNEQEDPWEADGFWCWWAKTSPPDRKEKEALPPGEPSGRSSKSKCKKRKKPPKNFRSLYMEC